MDVQVGKVDIQALEVPGASWVSATLVVAMVVYIVATLYSLCRERHLQEPLLAGQMEL